MSDIYIFFIRYSWTVWAPEYASKLEDEKSEGMYQGIVK